MFPSSLFFADIHPEEEFDEVHVGYFDRDGGLIGRMIGPVCLKSFQLRFDKRYGGWLTMVVWPSWAQQDP